MRVSNSPDLEMSQDIDQVASDEKKDASVNSKEEKPKVEKKKKKKKKSKILFDKDISLDYDYGVPVKLVRLHAICNLEYQTKKCLNLFIP